MGVLFSAKKQEQMKEEIFSEVIGKLKIQELTLKLIIIDLEKEEIIQWIN